MPDEVKPLSPKQRFRATVRDRERQRDELQQRFDAMLVDAALDDRDLQDALATDNDNMLLRAERDELQRQLDAKRQELSEIRLDFLKRGAQIESLQRQLDEARNVALAYLKAWTEKTSIAAQENEEYG
jgi:hypothetical protein